MQRLMPLVTMRVDDALAGASPPLTQARVRVVLSDGRTLERAVSGARGYPTRPVTTVELDGKFLDCAVRSVSTEIAERALNHLRTFDTWVDVRALAALLAPPADATSALSR